jgi:hypothetical protein
MACDPRSAQRRLQALLRLLFAVLVGCLFNGAHDGFPRMTLPDYPSSTVSWDTGLKPEMLQALGNLAVVSSQAEELLHQVYWHHAGLNAKSGPIVTDNLNPKRLHEDIIKLASIDASKANIVADLRIVLAARNEITACIGFGRLRQYRQCQLHLTTSVIGSIGQFTDRAES